MSTYWQVSPNSSFHSNNFKVVAILSNILHMWLKGWTRHTNYKIYAFSTKISWIYQKKTNSIVFMQICNVLVDFYRKVCKIAKCQFFCVFFVICTCWLWQLHDSCEIAARTCAIVRDGCVIVRDRATGANYKKKHKKNIHFTILHTFR